MNRRKCDRCKKREAEWILYPAHYDSQNQVGELEDVCGHCVPPNSTRISAFAWRAPEDPEA